MKICHLIAAFLLIGGLLLNTAYAATTAAPPPLYRIEGLPQPALQNATERLALAQKSYGETLTKSDLRDFMNNIPQNIKEAIEPYGYFKSRTKTQLRQENHHPLILIHIDPGPALPITAVNITVSGAGKDNAALQKLLNNFPLKPGQTLMTDQYEKAKTDLLQLLNNEGYLKAILEKKELRIHLKKYSATIVWHVNTGARYYFGHFSFNPNPYAEEFMQRFATISPDEPFSSEKLIRYQEKLRGSPYFQQAEVSPEFNQIEDHHVPVLVDVTAPKSRRYNTSVGYGTFTGPRLTLGADFRRVTDTGHRLNTELKLSSVLSGFAAKYFIPGKNPLTDQYSVGFNTQYFNPKNGSSFSQTLSGSYSKTIDNWQNTYSLNYLNERYQLVEEPTHRSQVVYPSAQFTYVKADNRIFPRNGRKMSFNVQGASEQLFSKTSFFQTELSGKYVYSPTSLSRLIVRGDAGYTIVRDLNDLPLTLRFFAGGLNSVRAYPYSSIGPGRFLEVASAEAQHQIIDKWYGAVFYDVGNASDVFNGSFSRGEGIGIIYLSFIGPIQLYVGRAMSTAGKPLRIEFNLGPDF